MFLVLGLFVLGLLVYGRDMFLAECGTFRADGLAPRLADELQDLRVEVDEEAPRGGVADDERGVQPRLCRVDASAPRLLASHAVTPAINYLEHVCDALRR